MGRAACQPLLIFSSENVYATKPDRCLADDDRKRCLLGSWANTYKGVKNYRFELFYWDYAVGIFLISLLLAFTMGSSGHDSASFSNNIQQADASNIINALLRGFI